MGEERKNLKVRFGLRLAAIVGILVVLIAVIAALVAGGFIYARRLGPVPAHGATVNGKTEIPAAIRYRESFGLSTDALVVEVLEADPTADGSYGVALSTSEAAEVARGDLIAINVSPLQRALEAKRARRHTRGDSVGRLEISSTSPSPRASSRS